MSVTSLSSVAGKSRKRKKSGGRQAASAEICPWCRRDFSTTPNPIIKDRKKCEMLPRCRQYGPCDCCRATKKAISDTRSDAAITQDCKDDTKQAQWLVSVLCREAQKNGEPVENVPGYVAPASRDGPPQTVTQDKTIALVSQIHIANFWPTEVLMPTFDLKSAPPGEIEDEDAFGKRCKGVWRDPAEDPQDLPGRVRKLFQEKRDTAKQTTVVDRSKDHVREGQGTDAWQLAKNRVSLRKASRNESGDAGSITLETGDGCPASDDDDCFALMTLPSASSQRQSGTAAEKKETPKKAHKARASSSAGRERASISADVGPPSGLKPVIKTALKKNPKSNVSTLLNRMTWKERQKASREVQACTKLLATVGVTTDQFCEDGTAVTVPEAQSVLTKIELRLSENNRWVYNSEDVDLSSENAAELCQVRTEALQKLLDGQKKFGAMVQVLKSAAATKAKDPTSYDPDFFMHALEDCCEVGLSVSTSLAQKYVARCNDAALSEVVQACQHAWDGFVKPIASNQALLKSAWSETECCLDMLPDDLFDFWIAQVSTSNNSGNETLVGHAEEQPPALQDSDAFGIGLLKHLGKQPANKFDIKDIQRESVIGVVTAFCSLNLFSRPDITDEVQCLDDGDSSDSESFDTSLQAVISSCNMKLGKMFSNSLAKIKLVAANQDLFVALKWLHVLFKPNGDDMKGLFECLEVVKRDDYVFGDALKCPLGLFLHNHAAAYLRDQIQADRAMRRVSALQASVSEKVTQHLLAKVRASDTFGARFTRSLSTLKESVLERRKIVAVVGEERLARSEIFKEVENSLESFIAQVVAIDGQKFIKFLTGAIENVQSGASSAAVMEKLFTTKEVQSASGKLSALECSLKEMSWKGLCLTEELDAAAEKLRLERIALVTTLAEGLVAIRALDGLAEDSPSFDKVHGNVHKFIIFLQGFCIDCHMLSSANGLDTWQFSACRRALQTLFEKAHRQMHAHYTSDLMRWHSHKACRLMGKGLDAAIVSAMADLEKDSVAQTLGSTITSNLHKIWPDMSASHMHKSSSGSWRLAATGVLLCDSSFKRRDALESGSMTLHSDFSDVDSHSVSLTSPESLLLLASFMQLVEVLVNAQKVVASAKVKKVDQAVLQGFADFTAGDWPKVGHFRNSFTHMVESVFTSKEVCGAIEAVISKLISNFGLALVEHINVLSVLIVEELVSTTDACKKDNLQELITEAEEISQAVKDNAIKIVKNHNSQVFKKAYRVWHQVKDIPSRVMADIVKQLPDIQSDSSKCDQVSTVGRNCGATLMYAMLAISQNCLRPLKPGEVASQLHSAARECQAVKDAGEFLPPMFVAILGAS